MKVKLNVSLAAAAVMLFMLSMTGYAMPGHSHSHEASGNIALENPDRVTPGDKAKLGIEDKEGSTLENPLPTSPRTSTTTSVSAWLEARAAEEVTVRKVGGGKSSAEAAKLIAQGDEGMELMGGGWCDFCGCWMRHGCDSNGNCTDGHAAVCGGGRGCYLHTYNPYCFSS